jgi:TATA-box binding protein (TBP) (component of TFIID and TFIIIB)
MSLNKNNLINFIFKPLSDSLCVESDKDTKIKKSSQDSVNDIDLILESSTNYSNEISKIINSEFFEIKKNISSDNLSYDQEIDIYAIIENKVDNYDENENIFNIIKNYRLNYKPNINITPLSVSVQSAKALMTMSFDLQVLSEIISESIIKYRNKKNKFSILGIFYKDIHEGIIKKPKPRKKGAFPNNMAILIKSPMGTEKIIHMKIFKNGSISMVGCKIKEDGFAVTKILENFILKQSILFKNKEKDKFRIVDFETTMVNSNYSIGFKIDRDRLFTFLQNKYNNLFSSYDPAVYAAVKIGFFYNSIKTTQDGICSCINESCNLKRSTAGKGCGNGHGKCKKVTIAIFESGNIVITGGRNINQANAAYEYINNIIRENAKEFALLNISDIYN